MERPEISFFPPENACPRSGTGGCILETVVSFYVAGQETLPLPGRSDYIISPEGDIVTINEPDVQGNMDVHEVSCGQIGPAGLCARTGRICVDRG